MDPHVKRALEAIDRVCETPSETGPVELDPEYLRAIERVESLPQNRSGCDKTWVEASKEALRELLPKEGRSVPNDSSPC